MAVTQVGSHTTENSSSSVGSHSYSHTTTADTDLLVLVVQLEGNEEVDGTPTWNSLNFTLIDAGTDTGSNGDTRTYIYGMVSPGAATATVSISFLSNCDPSMSACINYAGTDTASVAAATNVVDAVSNTSTTSTTVFSSGGASGNGLFVTGVGQGQDMQPASLDNGFSEIWDEQTGGSSTRDFGHIGGELLSGLPSGVTITWGATDENSGVLIELVAAAAGGAPGQTHQMML